VKAALSLRLAYEHVRAGFGRMALSVLAVALGVALVVAIRLMNAAVLASFLDTVDAVAGRAALTVTAGEGLTFPETVQPLVAAVPGVRLAVPLVRSVAFPDDGSGELLTVHGVDLANDTAVRVYHTTDDPTAVVDDLLVFLSQPDSIILGKAFAARRGLTVGSRLPLVTPTGVQTFVVRGLLEPQGLAKTLGGRLVVMDLYAAERAFTADGQVNQLDLVLADGADVAQVQAAVAAVLPPGLRVEEPALRKDVIRRTVSGFQAMLTAFGLLAVLAGFIICYSRLGAIFEARTWEVGLLRAVGLRRLVVFGELLKESLLLGAVGTGVGLALGVAIGRWGLPVVARATAINFRLPTLEATPTFGGDAIVMGILVGILAAVLAATVPALRLARKQPVAALRLRGRETPRGSRSVGPTLGLASLAACAGLVLWQRSSQMPMLGLATTALFALAACALTTPLVATGSHGLAILWRRLFGVAGEFAADHLAQQPRRAALTVATVGIGLGAAMMFGILAWSFERTLVSQLTNRLRGDFVVTSAFVSDGYRPSAISEDVLQPLRAIRGVTTVTGEQERDVTYGSGSVLLDAYDRNCFVGSSTTCRWALTSGAAPDAVELVASGRAVLVSTSFAHLHGTQPGKVLDLDTPRGRERFPVVGVTTGQPVPAVIMSRKRYQESWHDPLVTWVHVAVSPAGSRETVRREIMTAIGERHRIQVRSSRELIEYFAGQARQAFGVLYLVEAITFLLVAIAIGDTLAGSVIERTRQFAMMRAIGLPRSRLASIVVMEGLGVGTLGLCMAAATGLVLGGFWVEVQFPALLGWQLEMHFPTEFALAGVVVTLALCLVGSLAPAIHAGRTAVPQALRNE
jgi:putative ABC transport system permease protein